TRRAHGVVASARAAGAAHRDAAAVPRGVPRGGAAAARPRRGLRRGPHRGSAVRGPRDAGRERVVTGRAAAAAIVHPDAATLAATTAARLLVRLVDLQSTRPVSHVVLTGGTVGIRTLAEVAA